MRRHNCNIFVSDGRQLTFLNPHVPRLSGMTTREAFNAVVHNRITIGSNKLFTKSDRWTDRWTNKTSNLWSFRNSNMVYRFYCILYTCLRTYHGHLNISTTCNWEVSGLCSTFTTEGNLISKCVGTHLLFLQKNI